MNLDGLRVNHTGLSEAVDRLQLGVNDINNHMNRLEADLELLREGWSGQAKNNYRVAKAKWDWAIQEMNDLLDKTGRTVYQSNEEYKAADARGAAKFDF